MMAAAACGQTAPESATSDAGAATTAPGATGNKTDASTTTSGNGNGNGPSGTTTPTVPTTPSSPGVCDGGAPFDAGPCDWSRIKGAGLAMSACMKPGAFCDRFGFTLPGTAGGPAVPPAFACSVEVGQRSCFAVGNAGSQHVVLNEATLEAACAVTQAFPAAEITCDVYD